MKRYRSWRYKCDFCGKTGGSGGHMKRHEIFCTNNPHRRCRMCAPGHPDGVETDVQANIEALGSGGKEGMERLREAANDCPACILAAIRQSELFEPGGAGDDWVYGFDFQQECATYFEGLNTRLD